MPTSTEGSCMPTMTCPNHQVLLNYTSSEGGGGCGEGGGGGGGGGGV